MTGEVRQFRILNALNQYIDLLGLDNFGTKPDGLGLDLDVNFYQSFNTYADVAIASKQTELKFNIILGYITKKAYQRYNQVLAFLNVGGLKLEYTIPDVGTFIRDVSLSGFTKSEKDEYNVLQEELSVKALTPWYSWVQLTQTFDPVIKAGIIYDDTLGLTYDHKAYAWSADGATRFTTRFPNLNMLKNAKAPKSFKGRGGSLPARWTALSGVERAETIGVYDSTLIKAGILVTTKAAPSTSDITGIKIEQLTVPVVGDKFVLSYYVKNTGKTPITLVDRVTLTNTTLVDTNLPRVDGKGAESYTIPADGKWHLQKGPAHVVTDTIDMANARGVGAYIASAAGGAVANSTFEIGLPKLENNDVATPWLPTPNELTNADYPSYVGTSLSDSYNDSEVYTDYKWATRTNIQDFGNINTDLDKADIFTALSWSADGTKGFCTTLPNKNLWDEGHIVAGYVDSSTGNVNSGTSSAPVSPNHQTMTSLTPITKGVTTITVTIYNPQKKKQATKNTNRIACFNSANKFLGYITLYAIDGTEVETHTYNLLSGTTKVRLGAIHGFNLEKDTTLKFKYEEGSKATPYTPYWEAASYPNLLLATSGVEVKLTGTATATEVVSAQSFKLFDGTFFDHFTTGDKLIVSADITAVDSSGVAGTIIPRIKGTTTGTFDTYDLSKNTNGRHILKYTVKQNDIGVGNSTIYDSIEFVGKGLKATTTVTIKNIKMERDTSISLYRKAVSEDANTDFPCYIGKFAKHGDYVVDKNDRNSYKWALLQDFNASTMQLNGAASKLPNLVVSSQSSHFQAQPGFDIKSSLKIPFANGASFSDHRFKENGMLLVSFDWSVNDPTGPDGAFAPQLSGPPYHLEQQLRKNTIYPSINNTNGRYVAGCVISNTLADPTSFTTKEFEFRMDNMKDTSTITISNFKVEYYAPEYKFLHFAYAWSSNGSDRFTTMFPRTNVLSGTRLSGKQAVWNDSGIEYLFDNGSTFDDQNISPGDMIVISYDYSIVDTANHFEGRIVPVFNGRPSEAGISDNLVLSPTNKSGTYSTALHIDQTDLDAADATGIGLHFIRMDPTVTVTVSNFKMELITADIAGYSKEPTEWMPSPTEVVDSDYPGFVGKVNDANFYDPLDHTKYTWTAITDIQSEKSDVNAGDLISPGRTEVNRIVYNDTTIYQVDYSKAASYIPIVNDSMYFGTQTDSSLRIRIRATAETGPIINPGWYITDTQGNTLQTESFLTTIPVGFELIVSSDSFERQMIIHDPTGTLPDKDVDSFIDPTATGWIRIPVGETRLVMYPGLYTATGGFNGGLVSVEFKKEWLVV